MLQKLAQACNASAKTSARKRAYAYAIYFYFCMRDVMSDVTDATRSNWLKQ